MKKLAIWGCGRYGRRVMERIRKDRINPCCIPTLFHGGVHYFPVVEWPIHSSGMEGWQNDYEIRAPRLEMAIQNAICVTGEGKRP